MPTLTDAFGLDNGSRLPWLKLLTDAVYSMQHIGIPLELMVNQLPQPNSDSNRVLRKRLQQWIDQGLLKLYQSSIDTLPILCLSTQQQNRIALELHRRSESDQALEWFQTRSQEGIERVYNRLHNLRSQARLVPAAKLEDPDTFVVCPEPNWGYLSLLELQQRLGLDRPLMGSKAKKVFYRDRYLDGKKAKILADLLQSDGLDSNSDVTILVLQDSKSQSTSELKAELERALVELTSMGVATQVKVQPWHQRVHFPHARQLEIQRQDGQKYKVIFDKGMDFLEVNPDGTYRITEPTYVVMTSQIR